MAWSDFVNQLLGGLGGAGQGYSMQQQLEERRKAAAQQAQYQQGQTMADFARSGLIPRASLPTSSTMMMPGPSTIGNPAPANSGTPMTVPNIAASAPSMGSMGGVDYVRDPSFLTPEQHMIRASQLAEDRAQARLDATGRAKETQDRNTSTARRSILKRLGYSDDYADAASQDAGDYKAAVQSAHAGRGAYETLVKDFPTSSLAKAPYDPANAAGYSAGLTDARQGRQIAASQQGDWAPSGAVDASGQPVLYNKKTGAKMSLADTTPRPGGGGAGGASAQSQQARLLAAVSEARLADERMRAFEDQLLSGKTTINPLEQTGGTLMTNLSGSHSVLGALTQAGSELGLNASNPEYTQYLRDAGTIGRAEQMISPRGGNETMVRANSLLARAGTGAMKNTIDASRMARQALFGLSGGIEQALTPTQSAKLKTGLAAIKRGEGNAPSAPSATKPKPSPFGMFAPHVPSVPQPPDEEE